MFSQAPKDNTTPEQKYLAGELIRKHLDKVGLGGVVDYIDQMNTSGSTSTIFDGEPSVTVTRRRFRPFSPIETATVAQEDSKTAVDLMELSRIFDAETARQKQQNSYLYEQMLNNYGLG